MSKTRAIKRKIIKRSRMVESAPKLSRWQSANVTLEQFIADKPRLAKFLEAIRIGAHPRTAAAVVGLSDKNLMRWIAIGSECEEGSLQGELFELVRTSIGNASLLAEAAVLNSSPATYLKSTTRAVLHTDSSAQPAIPEAPTNQSTNDIQAVPTLTLHDLAAAMLELSRAGICIPGTAITLDASPPPASRSS